MNIDIQKHHTSMVRIISGQYRRRLLPVIHAPSICQLRPTPDRVRQTLFNWLSHYVNDWTSCTVLDAFAGTGALGFEAASRGAGQVIFCETFKPATLQLKKNITMLNAQQCKVYHDNIIHVLKTLPSHSLDIVFLDPPFYTDDLTRIYPYLSRVLKVNALVYIETECITLPDIWQQSPKTFEVLRTLKAGIVCAFLLRYCQN